MARKLDPLAKSALVVAHPDDEVLWFSSIVGRVARIVVCYEHCAELPELGAARRRTAEAYPLATALWLRHAEPCTIGRVDWKHPVTTEYGIALNGPKADLDSDQRYRNSFAALGTALEVALSEFDSVFTHNPWGEYGHADHVQVSRAVRSLQAVRGFSLLYSSYVAPRSMPYAAEFLPRLVADRVETTDTELFARIRSVYGKHGAWTWDIGYEPPANEAFLVEASEPPSEASSLPLTCLMTPL
jgi:LmbE family N-acetylglucosaminyl deacetylase